MDHLSPSRAMAPLSFRLGEAPPLDPNNHEDGDGSGILE